MNKINLLSRAIYNRIAAGEVVERPYSAVKELVENSLDAGATEIEIYIEKGGKQLIKVVDNGGGIEKDDLPRAIMPHATSKISVVEDLDEIKTLGFRGEALSSICSVAKVDIISVTAGNAAYSIRCEGGVASVVQPAALEKGTEICVRDLFYNTPARAKFLNADRKEESDITSFVSRFILSRPNISFRYYVDGRLALESFGGGLDEALVQVYGAKTIAECIKIDATKDGIRLHGFIGNQNFFKPNKTYQSIFLNGRYIVNNTLQVAINQAYAAYAMKRQYPLYVLNLEIATDLVDVNVHPNKADVRFVDQKAVFGAVYSIITSILDGTAQAADFVVDKVARIPEIKPAVVAASEVYGVRQEEINAAVDEWLKSYQTDEVREEAAPTEPQPVQPEQIKVATANSASDLEREMAAISLPELKEESETRLSVSDETLPLNPFEKVAKDVESRYFAAKQAEIQYETLTYRGNLFNTYLIFQQGDAAYIVDQHAAHERILYDKFRKQVAERNLLRQPLLAPYIFSTSPEEGRFLEENIRTVRSMGFAVEPYGADAFKVAEVPFDFRDINLKTFFNEIFADMDNLRETKMEDILKDKIAQKACKAAIKGGDELTQQEIDELLRLIDGNFGLKCPHGRPVCVKLTKREVEKMFKRIV